MGSTAKVPVFATTSLGTNIAIDVSPNITAGDLKSEIERAHLNCFPKVGEIRADGLMVKKKSFFYLLPDSLPIKHVFQGAKGAWFSHIEVCSQRVSDKLGLSECLAAEIRDQTSNSCNIADSLQPENSLSSANMNNSSCRRTKRGTKRIPRLKSVLQLAFGRVHLSKRKKRKRVKKNYFLHPTVEGLEESLSVGNEGDIAKERENFASITEGDLNEVRKSNALLENPSETFSETVSVSGIIKKYFSDYEEVTFCSNYTSRAYKSQCIEQLTAATNDNCSETKASVMPQFTPKTLPRSLPSLLPTDRSCKTSRNKIKRPEVGKRLVVASNKLGISASMRKSATGLCGRRDRKLMVPESSSLVRSLVFEVSDSDE
ncbi:uncharacterized protein LOC131323260 isoform X2 [Rhododendron vialii]|uniref:uncharacterized protein LOC131323260 isoform X2 n=2 Tax=Rhododendron vialii TaxID=182163 RepID=UPI00265D96A9|nr:uncharacterized protein LOC131323260 isoform X2 [Rhododendron vialii]